MRLFGKKKEEEIQEEKNHIKKIRDLKPENRRKRKEPPKPWGKKERFLILGILIITILSALFFSFSSQGANLSISGLKKPLLNLNFLKGETIVVKKTNPDEDKKTSEAVSQFNSLTGNLTGQYGLYVVRLDDGSSYGVKEGEMFQGASLLKLSAMIALYKDAEDGNIDLSTNYALKDSDKVVGSGPLYDMAPGTLISYKDLVMYMGQNSDRTAYKIAKDILGKDKVRDVLDEAGATHTDIDSGETTPQDVGLILENLWRGKLVSDADRDEILQFLTSTVYEDWLPKGIPEGVRVAHKVGEDDGILADAGIVFSPKPIIIVIMSEGANQDEAGKVFSEISKAVYDIEIGGL